LHKKLSNNPTSRRNSPPAVIHPSAADDGLILQLDDVLRVNCGSCPERFARVKREFVTKSGA
jgi:hypothetical protein